MFIIKDYVLIAGFIFNKGNIIELVSYSKLDVYKGDQLIETLETEEGERVGIAMTLDDNVNYTIMFEGNKIFDVILLNFSCSITPNNEKKFHIYKNTYVYCKNKNNNLTIIYGS
jgi:hypothetical protein